MTERKFGWIPDKEDKRDLPYKLRIKKRPLSVDLSPQMPFAYDQLNIGSCVANGTAGAIEYNFKIMHHVVHTPSRLFIYYNARVLEDSANEDSGCMIRDAIKTVARDGSCDEQIWAYDPKQYKVKPNKTCYKEAKKDLVTRYERIRNLNETLDCIASGYPVIFGVTLYNNFEPKDGIIPMPAGGEMGGHCMLACGYNDNTRLILVRNSWGLEWGKKGYCQIPYEYFEQAEDCWSIFYCI